MKRLLIRYKTRPDEAAENRRLIENVFAELQAKSPEGVRYMVLALGDDSFVHFVEADADNDALLQLPAFKAFQAEVRARCAELPQVAPATIVGNYRMLEPR